MRQRHREHLGRKVQVPLDGREYPMFARIRRADIECPRCGRIYFIGEGGTSRGRTPAKTKSWNPGTHRFRCLLCGLTLALGIIARRVPIRAKAAYPPDTVPTVEQALELRRAVSVLRSEEAPIGAPVNVVEPPVERRPGARVDDEQASE